MYLMAQMEILKFKVDSDTARRIRNKAVQRFGVTRGSISMALNEAVVKWLYSSSGPRIPASKLIGIASDIKMDSVDAQHLATKMRMKAD